MKQHSQPRRDKNVFSPNSIAALLVLFLLASAPSAWAQEPSPAPAGPAAAGEAGGEGGGGQGFDIDGLAPVAKISRIRGLQSAVPEVHVVKEGNTLWGITKRYFRNPYLWPALWSYNPQITNPHWIYPGDLVFLRSAAAAKAAADAANSPLLAFNIIPGLMVLPAGYYTDEELEDVGRVVFSPEEKVMLTFTDEAYIDWEDEELRKKVPVGQRFVVYHEEEPAENRDNNEAIARKLKLAGVMEVTYNDEIKLPSATVTFAVQEIERGDMLLPYEEVVFRQDARINDVDMEGSVIDTLEFLTQFGEQQIVLINRGERDGVKVGNRFSVFEQYEGVRDLESGEETQTKSWAERHAEKRDKEREEELNRDGRLERPGDLEWPLGEEPAQPVITEIEQNEFVSEGDFRNKRTYTLSDLPLRRLGEVMVIKTSDKFCTAVVMDSKHEFSVGHRVTMVEGY